MDLGAFLAGVAVGGGKADRHAAVEQRARFVAHIAVGHAAVRKVRDRHAVCRRKERGERVPRPFPAQPDNTDGRRALRRGDGCDQLHAAPPFFYLI